MNISQEKLLDIAVIAVLAVAAYIAIAAFGGRADTVSEDLASTRATVRQLSATRDRLVTLPEMKKLTTAWLESRNITDSCGVQRTVMKANGDQSLYRGAGKFWTAKISGDAIAVLTCADQLSELDQVAFEQVSIASEDAYQSAQLTFSMYGTFSPE